MCDKALWTHSKFTNHKRLKLLSTRWKTGFAETWRFRAEETKSVLYLILAVDDVHYYIGSSTRGVRARQQEHWRAWCHPAPAELPHYQYVRRSGMSRWICMPFAYLHDSTVTEVVRQYEMRAQRWLVARLCFPWVSRLKLPDRRCGHKEKFVAGTQSRKRPHPRRSRYHLPDVVPGQWRVQEDEQHELRVQSLSTLAMRISDPRRKGWRTLAPVRRISRTKPRLLSCLIDRIRKILGVSQQRLALARIKSVIPDVVLDQIFFNIALPHCSRIHPGAVFRKCYGHQLETLLERGRTIVLQISTSASPSLLKLLSSDKEWAPLVDSVDFPCCCRQLREVMGVHGKSYSKHFCSLLHCSPEAMKDFPANFNVKTNILPGTMSMIRSFTIAVNKFGRRDGIQLNHSLLKHFLRTSHLFAMSTTPGIMEATVFKWRERLRHIAVTCRVDKSAPDCAVICPRLWQNECLRLLLSANPDFSVSPTLEAEFRAFRERMNYTKCCSRAKHAYGMVSLWPKLSGFIIKKHAAHCQHQLQGLLPPGQVCHQGRSQLLLQGDRGGSRQDLVHGQVSGGLLQQPPGLQSESEVVRNASERLPASSDHDHVHQGCPAQQVSPASLAVTSFSSGPMFDDEGS